MRPGDPPTATNSKQMLHRMFFELAHYDLGYVGRHKINKRLGLTGKIDYHAEAVDEVPDQGCALVSGRIRCR